MRQINLVFVIGIMMISKIVAFQSLTTNVKSSTQLDMTMNRRDAWKTIGAAVVTTLLVSEPSYGKSSTFFYDDKIEEKPPEASQLPTGGKVDLNSAFVGDYTSFPGMYPHAAGQIASHGPYRNVKDIYAIPTVNENDKKMFKKYESEFTVNPPGRTFNERINARVST